MIQPKDIKTDSIEKVVCEAMDAIRTVPMDKDTSKVMVMFMLDKDSRKKAGEVFGEIFQATAIIKRMKVQFGREMDPRAAVLIAIWAKSIGACVLYMYYCQYQCIKKNITGEFTMDHLVEFFPMGFFPDEGIHTVWKSQKVYDAVEAFEGLEINNGGDNLVDYHYAAGSLMDNVSEMS